MSWLLWSQMSAPPPFEISFVHIKQSLFQRKGAQWSKICPVAIFFQMFGMTRHCCLNVAHRQACKKQKLMHGASYVIPSYQDQKCRQALTERWNDRRQAHVFLSSRTFHSWNQSEPELDQKESDFQVWDQCCICSPSMRASNSDRVHLVNKAW